MNTNDLNIDQCLDRLREGDESILNRLVERSYERFRGFASRQLDACPTARKYNETQDVLQEVFIKMLDKVKRNPPKNEGHFFAIVSRDIRNHLIDQLRFFLGRQNTETGESSNRDMLFGQPDSFAAEVPQQTYEPGKIQLWTEFHLKVGQLPDELRQVVDLLFYQGLTQEQAANVLGVSRKIVRTRWRKSKLILIDVLPAEVIT